MPSIRALLGVALVALPVFSAAEGTLVVIARAQQGEVIDEIPLTGTVIAARDARLSTQLSGLVDSVGPEIGDRVAAGDEILSLQSDMEALSLQAKRAEVEVARRELADARRRLADAERLKQRNSVSANDVNSLKSEVAVDGAVLARLQAEEQQQQLRVQRHKLFAPFDGVISEVSVELGEWVAPGDPLVNLVSLSELHIEFRVPQQVYPRLASVSSIEVRFEALPGGPFAANVSAVVPVSDRNSRTFLMRAQLSAPGVTLIPGISASAVLRIRKAERGVVVDRNALIRYPDGRVSVWVASEVDGVPRVNERRVRTGTSFDGQVSIIEGLSPGEFVVVNGNESLREGQSVSIKRSEG